MNKHDFINSLYDNFKYSNDIFNNLKYQLLKIENSYEYKLCIPGCNKDNINIYLENSYIIIDCSKIDVFKDDENILINNIENEFPTNIRIFLPQKTDIDNIVSECKDGILTIKLPEKEKPIKKIQII